MPTLFKTALLVSFSMLLLVGCQAPNIDFTNTDYTTTSLGSNAWQKLVDANVQSADAQGHGPDIGSAEWCRTIEFKLFEGQSGAIPCTPEWNIIVNQELGH